MTKIELLMENNSLIRKAYSFAQQAYDGQKRISGEDYLDHLLAVAEILADWQLDTIAITAGMLHDVIEETVVTQEKLTKEFGVEITDLVMGVTKIGDLKLQEDKDEQFTENLRKLIVVMARDLRVVLIKLADRYHNLQTLYVLPKDKQIRIARETMEVYAPLAERLGIGEMKGKLEDLAFSYLLPEEHQWLENYATPHIKTADLYLEKIKKYLLKALAKKNIQAKISTRQKHLYSLYKKLIRPEIEKDITKIYDLVALRIIVQEIEQCYVVLGIIHELFKPVPSKSISDFIAQPKPNGYQSIHTTVFAFNRILEIQIRTEKMHEQAENGIASHWYYTQMKNSDVSAEEVEKGFITPVDKMAWVKELVRWQTEVTDSNAFYESLKFDALKHRIFVFSPKGDVWDLPAESTPVDFAYEVHGSLGDQCIGAKVDGKMVSLDFKLKSGQMVEILINKNKTKPSADWIRFVVTKKAKDRLKKVTP